MKIVRRRALAALAGVVGVSALEWASLRGAFDHRHAMASSGVLPALGPSGIAHVGHSTHLVSVAGVRLLTDPWFYDPAFGALEHIRPPAVAPERIGDLDVVLISHDHPDHADFKAIDQLDKRAIVIAATSELATRAKNSGFGSSMVLAPWESHVVKGATITAVPGLHDVYEIGFVIEGDGHSVYFAGDTQLFDGMKEIRERLKPTMAILPVDGTRVAGAALHVMTPDDALEAMKLLEIERVMPSHAEARFSDPVVKTLGLASTIAGAGEIFASRVRAIGLRCELPMPGESFAL